MTTLAPASSPFSRPRGSRVPRAVVAGRRTFGAMSRITDRRKQVSSPLPGGSVPKGVSFWGRKGPMPHISG